MRILFPLLALSMSGGLAFSSTHSIPTRDSEPNVMAMPFTEVCTSYCYVLTVGCAENQHYADDSGDWNKDGGEPHPQGYCGEGTCAESHPPCSPERQEPDLEQARSAILTSNVTAFREFLAHAADAAEVNVQRGALQVFDCSGSIVVHLPLPEALLEVSVE